MINKNEQDMRVLFMERLCTGAEIDTPPPFLSCAVRYSKGSVFSHTVNGDNNTVLCAESVRHTVLAALCVLLSASGEWALSMPITAFLPQFPIKGATLFDLLCGTVPMKITGGLPNVCDIDVLCKHIAPSELHMPFPYVYQNQLLAALIELVSDMPLADICELCLFVPLGMQSTSFLSEATGHVRFPYHLDTNTTESLHEAEGKLFSTTRDLFSLLCTITDAACGKSVPVFTQKTASVLLTPHKETFATPAFQMRGLARSTALFSDLASHTAYLSMREPEAFLFTDTTYGVSFAVLSDNTALSRDESAIARLGNVLLSMEN